MSLSDISLVMLHRAVDARRKGDLITNHEFGGCDYKATLIGLAFSQSMEGIHRRVLQRLIPLGLQNRTITKRGYQAYVSSFAARLP